jgi:hypothetical protein
MEKGMGPSIAHLPGQGPHVEAISPGPARSSGVFDRPFVKPWPLAINNGEHYLFGRRGWVCIKVLQPNKHLRFEHAFSTNERTKKNKCSLSS